jgi:hypothetical protein
MGMEVAQGGVQLAIEKEKQPTDEKKLSNYISEFVGFFLLFLAILYY